MDAACRRRVRKRFHYLRLFPFFLSSHFLFKLYVKLINSWRSRAIPAGDVRDDSVFCIHTYAITYMGEENYNEVVPEMRFRGFVVGLVHAYTSSRSFPGWKRASGRMWNAVRWYTLPYTEITEFGRARIPAKYARFHVEKSMEEKKRKRWWVWNTAHISLHLVVRKCCSIAAKQHLGSHFPDSSACPTTMCVLSKWHRECLPILNERLRETGPEL